MSVCEENRPVIEMRIGESRKYWNLIRENEVIYLEPCI